MSRTLTMTRMSILSEADRIPALATVAVAFAVVVTTWDTRRRTRKHLGNLPGHLLKDVGLDPLTANREVAKPFWQP